MLKKRYVHFLKLLEDCRFVSENPFEKFTTLVEQCVIYLNKYQMLPSFYLNGEKGEVQARLVSM